MTSQPGWQTITINILLNISWNKENQTIKKKNILPQKNHAENEAERPVPGLFLFFKNALYEIKARGLQICFNMFRWSSTCHEIKTI